MYANSPFRCMKIILLGPSPKNLYLLCVVCLQRNTKLECNFVCSWLLKMNENAIVVYVLHNQKAWNDGVVRM